MNEPVFPVFEKPEKARYIAKLQEVGLILKIEPYSKESGRNLEMNMTIWPPSSTVIFLATFSLTHVCILTNSSYPGNSYGVVTISKANMLVLYGVLEDCELRRYAMPLKGLCQS